MGNKTEQAHVNPRIGPEVTGVYRDVPCDLQIEGFNCDIPYLLLSGRVGGRVVVK